jgi:predicted HicB family RNase H-like nuclease
MKASKKPPVFDSYEEIADFWDSHSLSDYWDQTEPVELEMAPEARRRFLISVDREVIGRVQRLAKSRGVSLESLVNLLLEQRLQEVETPSAR